MTRTRARVRLACAALCLVAASGAWAAPAGRVWTYQYVLATAQTERELAPITEHIIKEEALHEPALLDFAAEVLAAHAADRDYPLQNKIRLARVLAIEKSSRYSAVLERALAATGDGKIKAAARHARAAHAAGDAGYVPGTVDIHAIVADVDAAALAAQPTTAQGEHLAQFPGGSIDDLFEWAGKPQQIVSGQTRVTDGLLINVKLQRLAFFYRGLGRVVYGYASDKTGYSEAGWKFQAVVADPLAFEQEFSYRERARLLGMPDNATLEMIQLASGYTSAVKNAVQINYRRSSRPLEFMDTAAEILATGFQAADDPVKIDTYAWICRLLTQHGGQRYAALLQRVAAETQDPKLKRFAQRPIEKTVQMPAEPYVPGTVSLAAQRAQYPSPYPASTFQSGRL